MRRMISMTRIVGAALLAAALLAPRIAAAAENVDLLLVFAADVSRSIDQEKFQLQRDGYAAAITNPRVLDAIRSGPHHRIAVSFVEWSGIGAQKLLIDWTVIGDAASAQQFAAQLAEAPRSFADRTSISGALEFAMAQLDKAPFEASRRTIDVSGDGTNNAGRDVKLARDEALAMFSMMVQSIKSFCAPMPDHSTKHTAMRWCGPERTASSTRGLVIAAA